MLSSIEQNCINNKTGNTTETEKLDFWEDKNHYEVFEVTCIGWSFEKLT